MNLKVSNSFGHPAAVLAAAILAWMLYLGGLFVLPVNPGGFGLIPLAGLPILVTGWLFGKHWGLAASLFGTTAHFIFALNRETPDSLFSSLTFHLIGFSVLSVLGMLSGHLRDLQIKSESKISEIKRSNAQLESYSRLLETINILSTEIIRQENWQDNLADLIQELGKTVNIDHLLLIYSESGPLDEFSLRLEHYFSKLCQEELPQRAGNGTPLPSNLYHWLKSAKKGSSIKGQNQDLNPETIIFLQFSQQGHHLILPLFSDQTVWGFLIFECWNPNREWVKIELDAYKNLALTLTSTIHRKLIEENLYKQAKEFESLHQTSANLSSSEQLETGITGVLAQILNLLPAYDTTVYLCSQNQLIFYTSLSQNHQQSLPQSHPGEMWVSWEVIESKESKIIPDLSVYLNGNQDQIYSPEALISLPLIVSGEAIGVLNIWFHNSRDFDSSAIKLLRIMADLAATAIVSSQFLSIEREQRYLAESLRKAALQLTTNLELTPLLENLLEQVLQLVSAHDTHIFLSEKDQLVFGAAKYADSDQVSPSRTPGVENLVNQVAQTGERILIPDVETSDRIQEPGTSSTGSMIGLPLIFHGQFLGVMIAAFSKSGAYNEQILNILDVLSNHAAIAINNARTYESERDQRLLAEALQNTGKAIQSSLDLDTVLDQILYHIESVIPYDSANLMLVENGNARLVRRKGQVDSDQDIINLRQDETIDIEGFSTLEYMKDTLSPLIIPDTRDDPRWLMTASSNLILSWAGAPIIDEGEVIGFLSLNKKERNYYTKELADRLFVFAGQAAIALKHARMYEQIQDSARVLGAMHEATTTLVSTLNLDDLLEQILAGAIQAVPTANSGAIYLLNKSSSFLLQKVKTENAPELDDKLDLREKDQEICFVYHQKKAILFNGDKKGGLFSRARTQNQHQTRLAAPLPTHDGVLGVLYLESNPDDAFAIDDLELIKSISVTTASAIQNALLHAEIQEKALTDPLTEVYNRRGLEQWGKYEYERADRFDRPLAVIFFDLDHFKQVNDTHGHAIGDIILQKLVQRCQTVIRNVDILARSGGEEFVVILPETDLVEARLVAQRLRECIAESPFQVHSFSIEMTISLGVVSRTAGITKLSQLIDRADQYMYQAKQEGRNRVAGPAANQ